MDKQIKKLLKENETLLKKIEYLKQQKKEANARYRIQQQTDFTNRIHREKVNNRYKTIIYQLCEKIIQISPDDELVSNIEQIKKEFLCDRL